MLFSATRRATGRHSTAMQHFHSLWPFQARGDHILLSPHLTTHSCYFLGWLPPCRVQQRRGNVLEHAAPSITAKWRKSNGHTHIQTKPGPKHLPNHLPAFAAVIAHHGQHGQHVISTRPPCMKAPALRLEADVCSGVRDTQMLGGMGPVQSQLSFRIWHEHVTRYLCIDLYCGGSMHEVHACRLTGSTCGARRSRARRWSTSASSATVASGSAPSTSSCSGAPPKFNSCNPRGASADALLGTA